jgi:hypothetical protein
MIRQRFVVAVAALVAIAAGGFGTFHHSAAAGTVDKYTFTPKPFATAGTLTATSAPISVTVTATSVGAPVPSAVVWLSFASVGLSPPGAFGGSAAVLSTALSSTPQSFTANSGGQISITYTPAPAATTGHPFPTSGRDVVTAANLATAATVTNTDSYAFSALASFAWSPAAPIAASGTLAAHDVVTFAVIADDSTGTPIPSATVFLSLTSTATTPGSATAVDTNPAVTKTLTSTPKTFIADSSGMVSVTYTAPASLPNGGIDTITAQDKGTSPTVTSSDTYSFSSSTPPPPFGPDNVGAPQVAVTPDGSTQLVFWKDSVSNQLTEAWYTGTWNGPMAFPQLGAISSTPGIAVTKNGSTQLVFWQGPGGHLFEAWYTGVWNGPLDITTTYLGGQGILGSAPSVTTTVDGTQLVFWRGTDGHLTEAWYSNGWHGPTEPAVGSLASAPSSTISADGSTQLVFFRGTDNRLTEDWFAGGAWHGPMERGATSSSPSVAVTPDGSTQLVFYQGPGGHLFEDWYTGAWNGPVDFTATAFAGVGLLTSPPSATVTIDASTQLVFWQGAGNTLWEGWYAGGAWHGPVDWSAA